MNFQSRSRGTASGRGRPQAVDITGLESEGMISSCSQERTQAMPEVQRVSECQNCGVPLAGPYCSQCGQRGRYGRLRLDQIFHDLRQDLVCGDLSFMQTVKGMALAPGRTCQEYVQGFSPTVVS